MLNKIARVEASLKERTIIQHVLRQIHVLDNGSEHTSALPAVNTAEVSSCVSLATPVLMNSDEEFDEQLAALTSPRYEILDDAIREGACIRVGTGPTSTYAFRKEQVVPWSPLVLAKAKNASETSSPKMQGKRLPNDASEASPRTMRAKRAR